MGKTTATVQLERLCAHRVTKWVLSWMMKSTCAIK